MPSLLSSEVLEKYYRAGEIAAKVRDEMSRIVKEGMLLIDICEAAENMIRKLGGEPAFPCNISINDVAAHYTSPPDDKSRIPENSVVKIDIGVHVDGYIADTAATVCFSPDHESLVLTTREALEKAIKIIRPGLSISKFGSEVQRFIEARGFKPVSNLTGHQIGRYLIHAGKILPNVFQISISKIKVGEIYAVEPFVTYSDAVGRVRNGPHAYIFRFIKKKSLKHRDSRRLLRFIEDKFKTLPFAERWLLRYFSRRRYHSAFLDLLSSKALMAYPVFLEASGGVVAQAEHTILVADDEAVILT